MSNEDFDAREKFIYTLEWLLAVTKRYSGGLQFGLAHIDYDSPKILAETYGAQQTAHKLNEVLHILRKSFRKTDLLARVSADFWILVPFAPDEETLVDRIKYLIEAASVSGLQIVEHDISIFVLPNAAAGLDANVTALEFLAYLKKNHIALAKRELLLPAKE